MDLREGRVFKKCDTTSEKSVSELITTGAHIALEISLARISVILILFTLKPCHVYIGIRYLGISYYQNRLAKAKDFSIKVFISLC